MGTLIINFKNYPEVMGEGSLRLAESAQRVAKETRQEIIVAPPVPMIGLVARKVSIPVFAQGVSTATGERTTGSVAPEAVKGSGARGTIVNHSESRLPPMMLRRLVPRLASLSLDVCLCSQTAAEARKMAKLGTTYIAVEPPELIGSGVSVSKARPGLVSETVRAVRSSGFDGKILCGAGIVTGDDVAAATRLGTDGVLVSSSVVKAKDWDEKVLELARSLI